MRDHTPPGAAQPSPEILIPISLSRIRVKFAAFAVLTAGCAIFGATGWLTLTLLLTCAAIPFAVWILGGNELVRSLFFLSRERGR
ncbi:hypothetical protein [Nonomuraea insulae]|uniref:DUF2892 domain-containing protein n=1 Tax=Nonomuraea insulae TaxID=1616787 RepID=A0ABW1D985_9ACTN